MSNTYVSYSTHPINKFGAFTLIAAVITMAIPFTLVPAPQSNTAQAANLFVDISATPSSGPAPLNNVDLTATVSGTAAGPITYKFDCTADGIYDQSITTESQTFTAADLCNYSNPGSYTAKVQVERENLTFEGTTAILALSSADLFVDLSADPSSGPAPLNNVDLTAIVSGTATGNVTYKFDCTSDGSFEKVITTPSTTFTAADLCGYSSPGSFTATVQVERGGLAFQGTTAILVTNPPTVTVSLVADPSSGVEPLNGVDLTANVSGTATGPIIYKFDCTSDGTFDNTTTTNSNPFTATDLCNYSVAGIFTAKVEIIRGGISAQSTTQVQVTEAAKTLHVSISAEPSSGHAPLTDVDLKATVSGTATGLITYKFDCAADGSPELQITTSNTSFTATDLCDYEQTGVFTTRISVERGGLMITGSGNVVVGEPATLALAVSANPSFGQGSLNGVDITAFVSGSAIGPITYAFDCTADGVFEQIVELNTTSFTAVDLCSYSSPAVYTIKAGAKRGGAKVIGTTNVIVSP